MIISTGSKNNKKLHYAILDGNAKEKSANSFMPQIQGDEDEVKEGKGLKILTPNTQLTRFPVLLAQVKAENNSYKLKSEIRRQILYLFTSIIKSLKHFITIFSEYKHENNIQNSFLTCCRY